MKSITIRISLLQFSIFIIYMLITWYGFVKYPTPDPIATGLQQWACILVHFLVTLVVGIIIIMKTNDRKKASRGLKIALLSLVVCVGIVFLLDKPIWDVLWSLR